MGAGQKVVVLGGGESGVGAALLAKAKGWDVFVSDRGPIKTHYQEQLREASIPFETGRHTEQMIFDTTVVVKSPGIPDTVPLVQQLMQKGIPVISEIEFAWPYCTAKIIGITGSNGKTTSTMLIYHLLQTAGLSVGVGGNVGNSFSKDLLQPQPDWYVLELSSFQLDGIQKFRPDIAVLLNITPDHLDRYQYEMQRYVAAKFRITMNQQAEDLLIYNADNTWMQSWMAEHPLQMRKIAVPEFRAVPDSLEVRGHSFDLRQTQLLGKHNGFNAWCAIEVALELGATPMDIQAGLESFQTVPHRLEPIRELGGVQYINDSKATNVESVYYALDAMQRPIVWIAGGQDKGNDYESLMPLVHEKVRHLICLGADNRKLIDTFRPLIQGQILESRSAEEAVTKARKLANAGEVVLLSPACASFDLFDNYVQRGDLFREAVLALK